MGWGRWGYGGYGRYQPSKKSQAASLSTATLQRIMREKEEEAARDERLMAAWREQQKERERRQAEEARLEAEHGGKENLAQWRRENAERLAREKKEAEEKAAKAAADKKITDEFVALHSELALLPRTGASGTWDPRALQLNQAQCKKDFHLTPKDLDALPKNVVMKEGAKRASKISYPAHAVFEAVKRKSGKQTLREYQRAAFPAIAVRFVEAEMDALKQKHPDLVEKGRVAAVAALHASVVSAGKSVGDAHEALARAKRAIDVAEEKAERAYDALQRVATSEELDELAVEATAEPAGASPAKKQKGLADRAGPSSSAAAALAD